MLGEDLASGLFLYLVFVLVCSSWSIASILHLAGEERAGAALLVYLMSCV